MEKEQTLIPLTKDDYDEVLRNYPDSKILVVEGDRLADLTDKIRRSGAVLGKSHQVLISCKRNPDYHTSNEDMEALYEITGMFGCERIAIKMGVALVKDVKGARIEIIYQEF